MEGNQMVFHEKLSFIMNITNTTNSALAKSVCLDPSYISRLKNGKRKPSKNENYLKDMAYYLAKQCKTDSQKNTIYNVLGMTSSPYKYTLDNLSKNIYNWFLKDNSKHRAVENFIADISKFKFKKTQDDLSIKDLSLIDKNVKNGDVFYGIEGKRQGVIIFLNEILKEKENETLLLYSNEPIDWIIGDANFTRQWAALLSKVISKGNKIIIIHTINRSLNEMMAAIKEWLPLYMTGKIQPYYYPKARDGIFKKTLFIFSNKIALISSSAGTNKSTGISSNFIYTDSKIIESFSHEFYEYLNICKPLMQIFTNKNKKGYLSILYEFESENGDMILKTDGLSTLSIPLNIIKEILVGLDNIELEQFYTYHKHRVSSFKKGLQKNKFTEIITLPDIKDIESGNIKIHFSNMISDQGIQYSKIQIISHLKNIVNLMKHYDNYNVYIDWENTHQIYSLYVKDQVGVIIGKETSPSIVFAINERDMTIAFVDYMDSIINNFKRKNYSKNDTIEILNNLIIKIEKLL